MACAICDRLEGLRQGANPSLIHEFAHSYLVLGDHQFFPGYALLLAKTHAREVHELPESAALMAELVRAGQAVHGAFKPLKLNYSCYGNQDPHVHWHIFPRYETEPEDQRRAPPMSCSSRFASVPGTPAERVSAIARIRAAL